MGENVENIEAKSRFWWAKYLPIILAFGYVPIIVRGCFYARPVLSEQVWFSNGTLFDFFLFYKSLGIIACGGVSIAVCVILFHDEFKKLGKSFVPLWIYCVFVLASALFSPWKSLAFGGSYEMMEGLPVIAGYVALMLSTAIFIKRDGVSGIKLIVAASLPGILIITIIGFFQFFGLDFFRTGPGLFIIAGKKMLAALGGIATDMENPVYSTLYNADNASLYYIMMSAVIFGLSKVMDVEEKGKKRAIFIAGLLCVIVAIFTKVLTGYAIIAGLLIISICIWSIREEYWALPAALLAILIACVAYFTLNSGELTTRIRHALGFTDYYEHPINGISTMGSEIEFDLKEGRFLLTCEQVRDEEGNLKTDFSGENEGTAVECQKFDTVSGMFFVFTGINGKESAQIDMVTPSGNGEKVYFTVTFGHGDGIITSWKFVYDMSKWHVYYVNELGIETDFPKEIKKAEVFPDTLFNNRGSIWNHTIPTLSNHILLGSGANTFIMVYPQEDYIAESRYGVRLIDVKPHNFYLQQWSDNGLLALLALLTFIGMHLVVAIKGLTTDYGKTRDGHMTMSALVGVCAMLIGGITIDSNVCTSPVFWIILGVMVGFCTRLKRHQTAG